MFWRKRKRKDNVEKSTIDFGRVEQYDMSRGLDYVERLDLMTPKFDELARTLYAIKDDVERLHKRLDILEGRQKRLPPK